MPKSKKLLIDCEESLYKFYLDSKKVWHAVAVRDRQFSSHCLCGLLAPKYRLGNFEKPQNGLCTVCSARLLES